MKFVFAFVFTIIFGSLVSAQLFSIEDLFKLNSMDEDNFQKEMTKYKFTGFDKIESSKVKVINYSDENASLAKEFAKNNNATSKITYSFESKVFFDNYFKLISELKFQPVLQEQTADGMVKHYKKGNQILKLIDTQDPITDAKIYRIEVSQE